MQPKTNKVQADAVLPQPAPVGERLRYIRERILGISQSELGRRVGSTKGTIANIESGRYTPSLRLAAALEPETGIPARDFAPAPSPVPEEAARG